MEVKLNKQKQSNRIWLSIFILNLVAFVFLTWWFFIDGIYTNKVIEPINDYDPLNITLEKTVYAPGEVVKGWASFCKSREAVGSTQWTLVNDVALILPRKTSGNSVPVGCYENILFQIHTIPEDTLIGDHYLVGSTQHELPDGRIRNSSYKTEVFTIVNQ